MGEVRRNSCHQTKRHSEYHLPPPLSLPPQNPHTQTHTYINSHCHINLSQPLEMQECRVIDVDGGISLQFGIYDWHFWETTINHPYGFNENWQCDRRLCSLWFSFAAVLVHMVHVSPSPTPKMLIMAAILGKTITDEKDWMDFPSSLDRGSRSFQKAWSRNAATPLWLVGCVCCTLAPAEI